MCCNKYIRQIQYGTRFNDHQIQYGIRFNDHQIQYGPRVNDHQIKYEPQTTAKSKMTNQSQQKLGKWQNKLCSEHNFYSYSDIFTQPLVFSVVTFRMPQDMYGHDLGYVKVMPYDVSRSSPIIRQGQAPGYVRTGPRICQGPALRYVKDMP